MNDDLPLTTAQACHLLGGIDRSTLKRWVDAGKITSYHRVGTQGAYLFTRAEVERVKAEAAARAGAARSSTPGAANPDR